MRLCLALGSDGALVDQSSYADIQGAETRDRAVRELAAPDQDSRLIRSEMVLRLFLQDKLQKETRIGDEHCDPGEPAISTLWVASPVMENGCSRVRLIDREAFGRRLDVSLGRAEPVLRLTDQWLSIADDLGRVLVFELGSGRLIRNLRL